MGSAEPFVKAADEPIDSVAPPEDHDLLQEPRLAHSLPEQDVAGEVEVAHDDLLLREVERGGQFNEPEARARYNPHLVVSRANQLGEQLSQLHDIGEPILPTFSFTRPLFHELLHGPGDGERRKTGSRAVQGGTRREGGGLLTRPTHPLTRQRRSNLFGRALATGPGSPTSLPVP